MKKIDLTENGRAFEFMTTEFDGDYPVAIYRLAGVVGALDAECPRLDNARVASLASELFGRPCEYLDETLSCGTRHVALRYVEATARADAMERMVNAGVDVEDAAVVSGAAIAWVDTAYGATLKPVRAPSAELALDAKTVPELRALCGSYDLATTGPRAELLNRLQAEFREADAWEVRKANLPALPVGYRIIFDGGTEMPIALEHRLLEKERMLFCRAVYTIPAPVQASVVFEDSTTASSMEAALWAVRRNVGANYPVAEFLTPGQKTRAELEAEVAALLVAVEAARHEHEARAAWLASLPAGSCGNPPPDALREAEAATGAALEACAAPPARCSCGAAASGTRFDGAGRVPCCRCHGGDTYEVGRA